MIDRAEVVIRLNREEKVLFVEPEFETILQAAIDKDIPVPYSCMGGACSTCRAKLVDGSVEMDCNLILSDQEVEENYVLACQSRPTSKKVVIDFDANE